MVYVHFSLDFSSQPNIFREHKFPFSSTLSSSSLPSDCKPNIMLRGLCLPFLPFLLISFLFSSHFLKYSLLFLPFPPYQTSSSLAFAMTLTNKRLQVIGSNLQNKIMYIRYICHLHKFDNFPIMYVR